MRVGDLARRTGATIRALRYYERLGLVVPSRLPNGYRDYDARAVRQVQEIRELTALGLSVEETRPFAECLASGHDEGDECPASMAAYKHAIDKLTDRIARLRQKRDALAVHLERAANRAIPTRAAMHDPTQLPPDLPEPADDGAADHLTGARMPEIALPATDGSTVRLGALGQGRTILYVYPLTGRPGVDVPEGWDAIPGARGCTPEACGFRDHHVELRAAGAKKVYGLSTQTTEYQRELVDRLRLPFAVLSDPELRSSEVLGLPTFTTAGMTLYKRLTMVVSDGVIDHVFYPVFPPDRHAEEVLEWLRS